MAGFGGDGAVPVLNDCITRAAFARGLPLVDLRLICDQDEDYANPIEPSVRGGEKIAAAIAALVTDHGGARQRSEVFARVEEPQSLVRLAYRRKRHSRLTAVSGAIAYSLFTDYELGLVRTIPMGAQLRLDAASGILLAASPRSSASRTSSISRT